MGGTKKASRKGSSAPPRKGGGGGGGGGGGSGRGPGVDEDALQLLSEAFPGFDAAVVRAVLAHHADDVSSAAQALSDMGEGATGPGSGWTGSASSVDEPDAAWPGFGEGGGAGSAGELEEADEAYQRQLDLATQQSILEAQQVDGVPLSGFGFGALAAPPPEARRPQPSLPPAAGPHGSPAPEPGRSARGGGSSLGGGWDHDSVAQWGQAAEESAAEAGPPASAVGLGGAQWDDASASEWGVRGEEFPEPVKARQDDQNVEYVLDMFVEVGLDKDVVSAVLAHSNGNMDEAIETLLEMSNRPEEEPSECLPPDCGAVVTDREASLEALRSAFPDQDESNLVGVLDAYKGDLDAAMAQILDLEENSGEEEGQEEALDKKQRNSLKQLVKKHPGVAEDTLMAVLQAAGGQYSRAHEMLCETEPPVPTPSVGASAVGGNGSALPALPRPRANREASRPTTSAPERRDDYSEVRAHEHDLRRRQAYHLNEGSKAYSRGDHAHQAYHDREFHRLHAEIKKEQTKNQRFMIARNNTCAPQVTEWDSHDLTVKEASQCILERVKNSNWGTPAPLSIWYFITGKGLHSGGEGPKIKPAVLELLAELKETEIPKLKYEVDPTNEGQIIVEVWNDNTLVEDERDRDHSNPACLAARRLRRGKGYWRG